MTSTPKDDDLLPAHTGVGGEPPDGYRSEVPPKAPGTELPATVPHPLDEVYGVDDDGPSEAPPYLRDSEMR